LGKLLLIGRSVLYTINAYAAVLREKYEIIIHFKSCCVKKWRRDNVGVVCTSIKIDWLEVEVLKA
jgi:hypothetical protein